MTRLLRRVDASFAGPNDPNAAKVYEGTEEPPFTDIGVTDATQYYYKDYGFDGAAWLDNDAPPQSVTPNATYEEGTLDVRKLLKARLAAGFAQEIARGLLPLKTTVERPVAAVKLLLAPPDSRENQWPVCSIHLDSESPIDRGVGEDITGNTAVDQSEGWLAQPIFAIEAWSQNADERHELQRSIRRILQANLSVLNDLGVAQVEFDSKDVDFLAPQSPFGITVYCTSFGLRCKVPTFVYSDPDYVVIDDVDVQAIAFVNASIASIP